MWSKLKQRFKKNEVVHENVVCKNCQTTFTGNYCPNCGQAVRDYDRPISFIFYNFVGDFFAFDTRFFRTLGNLIARPGFLSKEYFDGRRVRYAPPFRVFIFVSFVLFFLLQMFTDRGLTTVLEADLGNLESATMPSVDSLVSIASSNMDSNEKAAVDSILSKGIVVSDSVGFNPADYQFDLAALSKAGNIRSTLNVLADTLEVKLAKETDPKQRLKYREYIGLCRSPENAVAKILEYISWAFFVLLPIFALILKLVYIRRKKRYMRHLVFSIHIHSFIFLVLTTIVALSMIFDSGLGKVYVILFFSIPLYIMIAMKKFYGQSIAKVILKFFTVSFLYNIVFWFVLVTAVLNAVGVI